jgi:hypothetical protein
MKIATLQAEINRLNVSLNAVGGPIVTRAQGGPVPGYASGGPRRLRPGLIKGPGTTTSDSIFARVSRGEHAFITHAARARQLWPLLNQLNFGSDVLVREILSALRMGLQVPQLALPKLTVPGPALAKLALPKLAMGGPMTMPVAPPTPAYAAGGSVSASGPALQPINLSLNLNGKPERASLLGERSEVAKLERMVREANRGRVRG